MIAGLALVVCGAAVVVFSQVPGWLTDPNSEKQAAPLAPVPVTVTVSADPSGTGRPGEKENGKPGGASAFSSVEGTTESAPGSRPPSAPSRARPDSGATTPRPAGKAPPKTASGAASGAQCALSYEVREQSESGWEAAIEVAYLGEETIDGDWTISWTFPDDRRISAPEGNGVIEQNGRTVVVHGRGPAGGGEIQPNDVRLFTFTGEGGNPLTPPSSGRLNDLPCAVG